jgi:hypothetical protein
MRVVAPVLFQIADFFAQPDIQLSHLVFRLIVVEWLLKGQDLANCFELPLIHAECYVAVACFAGDFDQAELRKVYLLVFEKNAEVTHIRVRCFRPRQAAQTPLLFKEEALV